jgi:hypothetical protein
MSTFSCVNQKYVLHYFPINGICSFEVASKLTSRSRTEHRHREGSVTTQRTSSALRSLGRHAGSRLAMTSRSATTEACAALRWAVKMYRNSQGRPQRWRFFRCPHPEAPLAEGRGPRRMTRVAGMQSAAPSGTSFEASRLRERRLRTRKGEALASYNLSVLDTQAIEKVRSLAELSSYWQSGRRAAA